MKRGNKLIEKIIKHVSTQTSGVKYLYLGESEYKELMPKANIAEHVGLDYKLKPEIKTFYGLEIIQVKKNNFLEVGK